MGGREFDPCHVHHPLLCSCIEYRTLAIAPRCQRHVCQILRSARGLYSCNRREWAHFVPRSLHRKFPFLARVSETGSMTGWGVGSSVPSVSTIQSSQTAHFVGDSKDAVSAGISSVSSPDFLSLWTSAVSRADFWPPVSASKNSVPGSWISRGKGPFGGLEIGDFGRQKMPFRAMAVI